MNSRVKTLVGLIVLGGLLLNPILTRAGENDDHENWSLLNSDFVLIEPSSSGQGQVISSYPTFLQKLLTRFLSWDPRKQLNNTTQLQRVLEFEGDKHPVRSKIDLSQLLRNLSVDFDVSDTAHYRKVWFQLNPQLKVRGLFGVHDFKKPRPLIVLRMGIHGNVDELLAERFIAKAVYEDLNANFLLLENLTSHAFLSENPQMSFGGVEEGLHTFRIINELKKSRYDIAKFTTDIHLIGISLGGQGTFVTALLDSNNEKNIKSVLDFCPLINLQSTFEAHAKTGFQDAMVDFWNFQRLKTIEKHYPTQLDGLNLWKTAFDFKPRFTPRVLEILNQERLTPLLSEQDFAAEVPAVKWPAGFSDLITKSKSFYEMNNFWKLYQDVNTPVTIYTTPKDFLVMNDLNSDMILENRQPGDFRNVRIIKLERGMHCGLASNYMWDDVVKMIQTGLRL